MESHYTLLIADKNPHIREFLKRELSSNGYAVHLAENCCQVLMIIGDNIDLLILDPELPDAEETNILEKLKEKGASYADSNPYIFNR